MRIYKMKNIMLGFGIGLVLMSLININFQSKEITVEFIKSEALKKGLIIIDPKEVINKDYNYENKLNDEKEKEFINVEIKEGFDSHKTCEILFSLGLIEDKDLFMNLLYKNKKTNSIQCGLFLIEKGISIEDIIDVITN